MRGRLAAAGSVAAPTMPPGSGAQGGTGGASPGGVGTGPTRPGPPLPPPGRRPGTDEAVMQAFAAGDLEAFGELVARHRDTVTRFCRRMLGDWHAAEDAAQEAFVGLYRCGARYAPSAPFRALLYRLARNACADTRRRRVAAPVAAMPETADPAPGTPQAVEARQRAATLRRALERLTLPQREVVVLTHFEGLTYAEAARVLRIPVGTVCSRAAAAFRALRRSLEDAEGGSPWN